MPRALEFVGVWGVWALGLRGELRLLTRVSGLWERVQSWGLAGVLQRGLCEFKSLDVGDVFVPELKWVLGLGFHMLRGFTVSKVTDLSCKVLKSWFLGFFSGLAWALHSTGPNSGKRIIC